MPLDDGGMGDWRPIDKCCLCGKCLPTISVSANNMRYMVCQQCFDKLLPEATNAIVKAFDAKLKAAR